MASADAGSSPAARASPSTSARLPLARSSLPAPASLPPALRAPERPGEPDEARVDSLSVEAPLRRSLAPPERGDPGPESDGLAERPRRRGGQPARAPRGDAARPLRPRRGEREAALWAAPLAGASLSRRASREAAPSA
jgi:hypothetical protein